MATYGIISQHANIGPTNKNTVTIESGRLNNYSIWCHHDFTDTSTFTTSGSVGTGVVGLKGIQDKSTYGHTGTGGAAVGLVTNKMPVVSGSNGDGQNAMPYIFNYKSASFYDAPGYTWANRGDVSWTNSSTHELNMRNMTIVYVMDTHPTEVVSDEVQAAAVLSGGGFATSSIFLSLGGTGSGEASINFVEHCSLGTIEENINPFGTSNIANIIFKVVPSGSAGVSMSLPIASDNPGTALLAKVNNIRNFKFNIVTVVGNLDGSAEMYIRDVLVDTLSAGELPDQKLKPGAISRAFNIINNGESVFNGLCYEYIIFDQALTKQELRADVWKYIKTKYAYNGVL